MKRTNERCYICDYSRPVEEDDEGIAALGKDDSIESPYFSGLSDNYKDDTGRMVFIHPLDNKPICTQCDKAAKQALRDMEWADRKWEPIPWNEEPDKFFSQFPPDLEPMARNIDWSRVKLPYRFPLPVLKEPRYVGWNMVGKSDTLSKKEREEIEEIIRKRRTP